jgi:hypothetical protein
MTLQLEAVTAGSHNPHAKALHEHLANHKKSLEDLLQGIDDAAKES